MKRSESKYIGLDFKSYLKAVYLSSLMGKPNILGINNFWKIYRSKQKTKENYPNDDGWLIIKLDPTNCKIPIFGKSLLLRKSSGKILQSDP